MKDMTPEDHASIIGAETNHKIIEKYMIGQKEHGGSLWRKPCFKFMEEEILDMAVYYHTIRSQITEAIAILTQMMEHSTSEHDYKAMEQVRNILIYGNKEGETLDD